MQLPTTTTALLSLLTLLTPAHAALATFKPIATGPSYSVGIPSSSRISATAPGPLYFSLSAPASYQWVGLGIGASMSGSSIFVMYPDGRGNVTLSARAGRGNVQPQADSNLLAGVELLAGSGVANGVMTANVRCTTCTLRSASTSTTSPWIAAWVNSGGTPSTSTSQSFSIRQHGDNDYRSFTFDLSAASISSDTNPFLASATTSAGTTSGPVAASPSESGSSSSSISTGGSSGSTLKNYERAHGIVMAGAVVLLFPIGAIIMRLAGSVWLHGAIQLFGLAALIGGFGIGVYLAQEQEYLFQSTGTLHTILGTVITGLFLFQPVLGFLHHASFKRNGSRGLFSVLHTWYGRLLMAGGVVNGGLGIRLAGNVSRVWKIVYIVLAAVFGAAYIGAVLIKRKGKKAQRGSGGSGSRWGKRDRDTSS